MLTKGLWWPELLRRAAGVEDGRRRRRSSVTGMTQRCSGLLGSTGPLVAKLRSEPGGQDGLSFAGGEQSPRRASSPETAFGSNSGDAVQESERGRLRKSPRAEAENLRRSVEPGVRWRGRRTAARVLCAAERGEAVARVAGWRR